MESLGRIQNTLNLHRGYSVYEVITVDSGAGGKGRSAAGDLFTSYGELAKPLLPGSTGVALYGPDRTCEWSFGAIGADRVTQELVESIMSGSAAGPQAARISPTVMAIAIPVALDGKPISVLLTHMLSDGATSERRMMHEVIGATGALLDCMVRELGQMRRKTLKSATLTERTAELEWLFALTESLHSNSNDPRAITQLMGAAVERMKCCFGAVVVPEHGLELTYSSLVHIDIQAAGAFERSRPYFMNYIQRRKEPLLANKSSGSTTLPSFKLLVVPIQPHKDKVLGFIAFFKQSVLPNFGRRQLFLGRHIGHQIGSLLESQYDLATGLLTRNAFEQDVQRVIAGNPSGVHSLLYTDIDHLHMVNDRLGFDAGDEAIVRIADLLRAPALPDNSIACRLGGDCFVMFLPDHDAEAAMAAANRMVEMAAKCFVEIEGERAPLSVSCGVLQLNGQETGLGPPLANAQLACQGAKEQGGNRAEIYLDIDASMLRRRYDVTEIAHLRSALVEGRFCIYAQKIVSAADVTRLRGIECLIRMVAKDGKIVSPAQFLPSAQRYQMLQAIDHWVISNALDELKDHRTVLLEEGLSVAINISGQSIQDEVFIDAIERWLLESMIAPSLLRFEITELAAISNLARAERLIRRLRRHGCGFALDDFGTGVNSLSYLKCLPVTSVKIDGSFTKDLLSNNRSDVVVQTIVTMCQQLEMETIAESVESLAVARRLHALGVDYVQGFAIHRPELMGDLLASIRSDASQRMHRLYLTQ